MVVEAPGTYALLLEGALGTEGVIDLDWNAVGYVSHVADNLRIWAERMATANVEHPLEVVPYDDVQLGRARRYNDLSLPGALWALHESVDSWTRAWRLAGPDCIMRHPDRGIITTADIVLTNAHDVAHHRHDIERCLQGSIQ